MNTISFFSFKGGVGRSALILNIGAYLASEGYVVAMIDMDLQSPGLSYNALKGKPVFKEGPDLGMSDILHVFNDNFDPNSEEMTVISPSLLLKEIELDRKRLKKKNGRLLLLDAGRHLHQMEPFKPGAAAPQPKADNQPKSRVVPELGGHDEQSYPLEAFAQFFKKDLEDADIPALSRDGKTQKIDFVLIDCRTGYHELLQLSLGYLADKMVMVSGLNDQNLAGLNETFSVLKKRIEVGNFPLFLTLVFSPIPAGEDEQLFERLQECHRTVKRNLRLQDSGEPELAPQDFSLHYTPMLAYEEKPISILHPHSLYAREVVDIAEQVCGLDQRDHERVTFHLGEQARHTVRSERTAFSDSFSSSRRHKQDQPESERRANDEYQRRAKALMDETPPQTPKMPSQSAFSKSNPFGNMPPWYWPMADPEKRIDKMEAFIKPNYKVTTKREAFLNSLYTSLSFDKAQKRKACDDFPNASEEQVNGLLKLFDDERREAMIGFNDDKLSLMLRYFLRMLEWAMLLEDEEAYFQRFVNDPFLGKGAFKTWEAFPAYWLLLTNNHYYYFKDLAIIETGLTKAFRCCKGDPAELKACGLALWRLFPSDKEPASPLLQEVERLYQQFTPIHGITRFPLALRQYLRQQDASKKDENEKDMATAIQEELQQEPGIAKTMCLIAGDILNHQLPFYEECEALLKKSIALKPSSEQYRALGRVYIDHQNQPQQAEQAFRQALAVDDQNIAAWNELGSLLQDHLLRFDDAEAAYCKAIAIDDNYAYLRHNLGNLLRDHLLRFDDAEAAYRKAIAIDENFAPTWNALGLLHRDQLQRGVAAMRCLAYGSRLDPKNPYLHINQGFVLASDQQTDQARKHLNQAYQLWLAMVVGQTRADTMNYRIALTLISLLTLMLDLAPPQDLTKKLSQAREDNPKYVYPAFAQYLLNVQQQEAEQHWQTFLATIANLNEWLTCAKYLYDLAGFRPEWRDQLQARVAELLNQPESWFEQFPNREAFMQQPLIGLMQRFAKGESNGLGDPCDRDFFFADNTIPDWLTPYLEPKT